MIHARLGDEDFDVVALDAISNIYRASAATRRKAEKELLSEYQLSWGGFTILWVLWIWDEMETADLAAECDLAKGTLTGMLNTLERRCFVERHKVESDRRRVSVRLTDLGVAAIKSAYPAFNDFETKMLAGLTIEEQRELARLLRAVIANASSSN